MHKGYLKEILHKRLAAILRLVNMHGNESLWEHSIHCIK